MKEGFDEIHYRDSCEANLYNSKDNVFQAIEPSNIDNKYYWTDKTNRAQLNPPKGEKIKQVSHWIYGNLFHRLMQ